MKDALKMRLDTKGQFNVEFFIVLIIFVMIATFFSIRLTEIRPAYINEVRKSIVRSEAYRVSEVLINDPGSPMNWDTLVGTPSEGQIKRIGLLDQTQNKTNLLSEQKLIKFNILCNGGSRYDTVKNLIGAKHGLSIIFVDKTGSLGTIECSAASIGENAASLKRMAVYGSGNYGELIVQVW